MNSRIYSTIAVLFCFAPSLPAQIPNAGFEQWTSGEPDSWLTSNSAPFITVTQDPNSHGGSSAAKGVVVPILPGFNLSPYLQSGPEGEGFPVAQRYAELRGFYRFAPVGGDRFYATVFLKKDTLGVGAGAIVDSSAASSYRLFVVPIFYVLPDIPDTAIVQFAIFGPTSNDVHVGSTFYVDDVSLSGSSDVGEHNEIPAVFRLEQNYPNPFNPSTRIRYALPRESHVTLSIYNVIGQEVARVLDAEQQAGNREVAWTAPSTASGLYFYRLHAVGTDGTVYMETRKMILMK